jgi:hypothetical protein
MRERPEDKPTETICPVCDDEGRVSVDCCSYATCSTCAGTGACPYRALDRAWLDVVTSVMGSDLQGANAALGRIRDGSFRDDLDPSAAMEAVEALLGGTTSPDA